MKVWKDKVKKKVVKDKVKKKKYTHVSPAEAETMKKMRKAGMGVNTIGRILNRSPDAVLKNTAKKKKTTNPVGRPESIDPKLYSKMETKYEDLLKKAKSKKEVPVKRLKTVMKLECSERTILNAFHDHGIYFRPLYEKPDLDKSCKSKRMTFGCKNKHRSEKQWSKWPKAVIDNKVFAVYLNGKMRDYAARRRVRGVLRGRKRKYHVGNTRSAKTMKTNTGQRSAMVTCAIGNGRVMMWHVTDGPWNARAAATMYGGPLKRALKRNYPSVKGTYRVIEDNCPVYNSKAAKVAKKAAKMNIVSLPPRSPDLNPLDFSLWAEVNRRMRAQEAKWHPRKKESRVQYLARLKRTAMSLPSSYIKKIMGPEMKKRITKLVKAGGGHFPEGGD